MAGEEWVKCQVCGKKFKRIQWSHLKKHGITREEYKKRFPDAKLFSDETRRKISESVSKVVKRGSDNPQSKGWYKTCPICGDKFWVKPSHAKESKTCSKKCDAIYRSRNYSGENHPSWKGGPVKLKCDYCGKEIDVLPYHARKWINHFCSAECYGKLQSEHQKGEDNPNWKGGKIRIECDYCGKIRHMKKSEWIKGEYHYCSRECAGKGFSKWLRENGPTYPEPYFSDKLGHEVRSAWEEEIGLLLKENGIDYWGYEIQTFGLDGGSYTPDYFIDEKTIVEVKGHLPERQEKNYRKFAETHPEIRFIIVGGPERSEEFCDVHIPWEDREKLVGVLS